MRVLRLAFGIAAAALLGAASAAEAAAPLATPTFKMPSGNIVCAVSTATGPFLPSLRCDILSGLRPEPTRLCEGDWTGLSLRRIGKGRAVCAGDTVYDRRAPALAYGRVWARNGFRCVSRTQGLTCTKAGGNGFFLSRHRWRAF